MLQECYQIQVGYTLPYPAGIHDEPLTQLID